MKILLFLFFMTLISLGHSLNCISARTFNMSSTNFNFSLFKLKIQQLKTFSNDECRLRMNFDYKEKLILIEFTLAFLKSVFFIDERIIEIETLIQPMKKRDSVVTNSLRFTCSLDKCERNLLFKHIRWFIAWEHALLADNLYSLMHGYSELTRKYLN